MLTRNKNTKGRTLAIRVLLEIGTAITFGEALIGKEKNEASRALAKFYLLIQGPVR